MQPKSYVLEMLPYPSGSLHMGHMLVYTIGDVATRFRARNGMHVLHPQGLRLVRPAGRERRDPRGRPPAREHRAQHRGHHALDRRVGWAYDWDRPTSTHDPAYYRWQQWQFLRFLERGLVYRKAAPVKWCPNDQTVLANEQVKDGRCERCGAEVESRLMEQWFFRITDYAQALLDDLETVDWPESIKARQRNWIGRSEGAEIQFRIEELDEDIPVFTTRPDTLYGATFFVLAPEHELVPRIDSDEVREYVRRASVKKTAERAAATEKTGVATGLHAINPVNGERLPVYVADYVLTDYGTGAIMAVPAHDQRDFDFARAFELPIRQVVKPADGDVDESVAYVEHAEGEVLVNSGEFDGLPAPEGGRRIVENLESEGRGGFTVNYRLRDWGSRASATGAARSPSSTATRAGWSLCPTTSCRSSSPRSRTTSRRAAAARSGRGLGERALPDLRRAGRGARSRRWTRSSTRPGTSCATATRTTRPRRSTAPGRLLEPGRPLHRRRRPRDRAHDLRALLDQGAERHGPGRLPRAVRALLLERLGDAGKTKMSKRAGNIVGPDDFLDRYGADACRLNILFLGPADEDMEWTETSVEAMSRFVKRLWNVVNEVVEGARTASPRTGRSREGARDDREGHRRHRPPLGVQHRDRRGDGARQRAVTRSCRARLTLRGRDRGVADPALCAARG